MRKAGKRPQDVPPYIVPLSVQAIEIVRYLLGVMRPAQVHLLTHRSELKKRISENTLNAALKRMGYEDQLTGHGIRGTISTALNEIGYPKIWVDAQLSHSDPNKVSSAYNHAKYVEPRRRMMQDWADRLDLLEQGQWKRPARTSRSISRACRPWQRRTSPTPSSLLLLRHPFRLWWPNPSS